VSFSAEDKGLIKYARRAQSGFSDLGAIIQLVGEQAARFTSQSMNLTTSLEASRFNAAKSAKMAAASMALEAGPRRQMIKDVVRLNEAYKISTSVAISTTKAFARNEDAFKAWGLSVDDAAKQGEAFGIDNEKLGSSISRLADLTKLKLTDDAFKNLGTELGNLAARTTDYGGTMKDLPGLVDRLALAQQNLQLSGEDVQAFAKGIIGLRGDISRIFDDPDIGKEFSESMTDALTGANKGMNRLLSGIENNIPGVVEQLAIAGFNVTDVFERMKKDPQTFTQELLKSIGKMKAGSKGYLFVRARLEEAFGEKTTAKLFEASARNAEKMEKAFGNTGVAMMTMSERARQGLPAFRTLQESLELMENQLETRLRGAFAGGRDYVKSTGAAFKKFGDVMMDISKEGGLAGTMAKKLAEIHQIGAQALLPKALQPMAAVLGTIASRLAPVIARLADMGVLTLDLWSPLRAVAAAGLGVAVMLKVNAMAIKKDIKWRKKHGIAINDEVAIMKEAKIRTVKAIKDYIFKFRDFAKDLLKGGGNMLSDIGDVMSDVWDVVVTVWDDLWPRIKVRLQEAWVGIKQFASGIFGAFAGEAPASRSQMQVYGMRVGEALKTAWKAAVAFWKVNIGPIVADMWNGFTGEVTTGKAGEIGKAISEVLIDAWNFAAEKLFPVMEAMWKEFALFVGEQISLAVYSAARSAAQGLPGGEAAFDYLKDKPPETSSLGTIYEAGRQATRTTGLESDITNVGAMVASWGDMSAEATEKQTNILAAKLDTLISVFIKGGLTPTEAREEAELRIRYEASTGQPSAMPHVGAPL